MGMAFTFEWKKVLKLRQVINFLQIYKNKYKNKQNKTKNTELFILKILICYFATRAQVAHTDLKFTMQLRLSLHSLCLCLSNTWMTHVCHLTWESVKFLKCRKASQILDWIMLLSTARKWAKRDKNEGYKHYSL